MGISTERYLSQERAKCFPKLSKELYGVTSDETEDYNCIAYAAGDTTLWWWPDPLGEYHWPLNAPREQSVRAFVETFCQLGYEECETGLLETGFEKVAIYFGPTG